MPVPIEIAADYLSIDRKTIYNWLSRGSKEKSGLYKKFFYTFKKARAAGAIKLLGEMNSDYKNWLSKAWKLERMYPEEFAKADPAQLRNKSGGGMEIHIHPAVLDKQNKLQIISDESDVDNNGVEDV